MITEWKECLLRWFKEPMTPKRFLFFGTFFVVTNAFPLIWRGHWLLTIFAAIWFTIGVIFIIVGLNRSSGGGNMRKIISRAARAIAAQAKRFSDWLCEINPARKQMLARILGTLVVMFGILFIVWATTLPAIVLALSQVVITILAMDLIIIGGLLFLWPLTNGYAGGVK